MQALSRELKEEAGINFEHISGLTKLGRFQRSYYLENRPESKETIVLKVQVYFGILSTHKTAKELSFENKQVYLTFDEAKNDLFLDHFKMLEFAWNRILPQKIS